MSEDSRIQAVEKQLLQSQKMEAVGRLAGGMAHDMNNVLGSIMAFASVLEMEMDPDDRMTSDVKHILEACKKGRDLMLNLLGFARRGKYSLEWFDLNERCAHVVDLLKHTIPKKIVIETKFDDQPLPVHGDPSQIHHAMMNICINAVDAMDDSGTLTIATDKFIVEETNDVRFPDLEPGTYARLRVADTGVGMSQEVMNQAFEPFFTTKPQGLGSGLGLPMVYGTIKNHGGSAILESTPDEGTVVTMLLPYNRTGSNAFPTILARRTTSDPALATILLIDDEDMVVKAEKRLIEKMGYKTLVARDGREGLRVFAENKDKISLVMLDMMMPVMDGEETFYKLREIDPEIPILLSSGYSKEDKAEQLLSAGADGFLQKPFEMSELRTRLSALLDMNR